MTESFLFDIPQSIEDYSWCSMSSSNERSSRSRLGTTTSDSSIIGENMPAQTGIDGLPREEWEALLREMRRLQITPVLPPYRRSLRAERTNLAMARTWEYLASKGLGLQRLAK